MFGRDRISQGLSSHRNAIFVAIFVAVFFFYFAPVLLYVPGERTFGFFGGKAGPVLVAEGRSHFITEPVLWAWIFVVARFLNPFATYNFIVLSAFPLACFLPIAS